MSRTQLFNRKGPAPIGALLKFAPSEVIAAGEPTKGNRASSEGKTAFFTFRAIFNVAESITSMVAIRLASDARDAVFLGSWRRRMLNFTAAASYGVPSLNLMFGFNFSV